MVIMSEIINQNIVNCKQRDIFQAFVYVMSNDRSSDLMKNIIKYLEKK